MGMQDSHTSSRRRYLKAVGTAGLVTTTGISGCLDNIAGGGPIPMGSILPLTGVLEAYGDGMQEGVNMAVEHANDAGGPLDREIEIHNRDSETREEAGLDRYEGLVADQDIIGFVGAASSGVSTPIAEQVADDQVMQVSPASTSPVLADIAWDDDLKYFGRTAPNDAQQGFVMAKVLNEYLEADTAGFLFVDNPYGEGLADVAREHFEGETVSFVGYDEEATDFTGTLDSLFEDDPEAIGFVGYPGEGESIMLQWDEGGYGGDWILSEGLFDPEFLANMDDEIGISGFHLTTPDPEDTAGAQRFADEFSADEVTLFAPHSYDAMFIQLLAMQAGGEASGEAISRNFVDVCIEPGEEITVGDFDRAKELLEDGEDITYVGASSPLEMTERYECLNQFAILEIQEGGTTESLEVIPREDFEGFI